MAAASAAIDQNLSMRTEAGRSRPIVFYDATSDQSVACEFLEAEKAN